MFIYRLLNSVSIFSASICVLIVGYYVWKAIQCLLRKKKVSFSIWIKAIRSEVHNYVGEYAKLFLIIALVTTLMSNTAIYQLVGIHNLNLKPSGRYCFFVEAHQLGGKNYTVPAQIKVEKETEEVGENRERTYTYYYIEKIVFSNGEVLDFEKWDSVKINEPTLHTDSNGVVWDLTLLNKHAYSPLVEETNNANWVNITFLLIEVASIVFLLYAMYRKDESDSI